MSQLFKFLNLQLFAEGGDGGGTAGDGANGVSGSVPSFQAKKGDSGLSNVQYGIQDTAGQNATVLDGDGGREAEFERLIKGEYKDLYDARMQETIQKRLRGSKEIVDKYNALAPTLDILARKYGIDASDVEALSNAIEEDDSYWEEEALEKGMTVEQLKSIRKMERENADLRRQMEEQNVKANADRIYTQWMEQADSLKQVYPGFDLNAELGNPRFVDLIKNNVDLRTAYEVLHKDEIIPAAMQFTARQVERKIANKIISGGSRPLENGNRSQSASVVKSDVSQLSKEDRAEIIRRVARGEKIRF